MAKPRGKSRSRAIMRLVIVAGIALYVLTSMYESRKQRALAVSIADRLRHRDDHAAHVGGIHAHTGDLGGVVHGMHPPHAHRAHSGSVGTGHASDDASDAVPASRHASGERGERLVHPVARGGSASVPTGWMDAATRGRAKTNANKDAGCAKGAHADDGGRVIDVLPRAAGDACVAAETVPGLCEALAELLPARGDESAVLVAFDDGKDVRRAIETAKAAVETGARAVLVAASDEAAAAAVAAARLPYARAACPGTPCARPQFALASAILALGADVLLVGHGATMHGPNPLVNLPPRRGADAEGVPASARALGQVIGMHDPKMGWSAYSQSMAVPHLMSSVLLLRATEPATRVAAWLGAAQERTRRDADAALTDELLMPAYDDVTRAGAAFRVLPSACFAARGGGPVGGAGTGVAAGVAGGGPATLPRGPMYFFFFLPPRLLSVVSIADRSCLLYTSPSPRDRG